MVSNINPFQMSNVKKDSSTNQYLTPRNSEPFPCSYVPVHPCLYPAPNRSKLQSVGYYARYPLLVLHLPVRFLLWLMFMTLNIISASIINAGTDQKRPLLPTRRRIYDACVKLWSWLVLLNLGYIVRVRYPLSELYGRSGLWVLPHASILDVFVANVIGGSTFVAKKHIADIPLVKPSIRATRSLIVRPNYGLFDELRERSKGDTPVVIFSEGTTTH